MTDLYDVLGVKPDATHDEIRAAYRQRAKQTHPDGGGSEAEFLKVSHAHRVLGDDNLRARYDKTGKSDIEPDNSEALIREMVLARVMQAVSAGVSERDAMRIVADDIIREEHGIHAMIREHENALARWKRFAKTVRQRDKSKPDFVVAAARSRIVEIGLGIEQLKGRLDLVGKAIELARNYEYAPEETGEAA